jgi:putative membrane protein
MRFFFNAFLLLGLNGLLLWILDTLVFTSLFTITGSTLLFRYGIAAMVFTIINTLIRPVLVLVTTPVRWLTLGVFGLVLNAFLLFVVQYAVNALSISGITMQVNGLIGYLLVGVVMALANSVIHWFVR